MILQDKVAIVTGGSRGIGKQTSILLAQNGCKLVINSRHKKELDATVKELRGLGANVVGIRADVTSAKDVKKLVDTAISKFHKLDILINNAGTVLRKPLVETTENQWDDIVDTNLKGPFLCSRESLPHMMKQKSGIIVNVGSIAAHYTFGDFTAYCASKSGNITLVKALSKEVGKYGIKVFAICPGPVANAMQEKILGGIQYKLTKPFMLTSEKVAGKILEIIRDEKLTSGDCYNFYR